jgi:hypothetical protein
MTDFLGSRDKVLDGLRREMIGPDPCGIGIDLGSPVELADEEAYGSFFEAGTGEEILRISRPTSRYGVGVLYPTGVVLDAVEISMDDEMSDVTGPRDIDADDEFSVPVIDDFVRGGSDELDDGHAVGDEGRVSGFGEGDDDLDLTSANQLRPSAMGISLLLDVEKTSVIEVELTGGRYESVPVTINRSVRHWWVRRPVRCLVRFDVSSVRDIKAVRRLTPVSREVTGLEPIELEFQLVARPFEQGGAIATIAVVNRSPLAGSVDGNALFQTTFAVRTLGGDGSIDGISPYPEFRADTLVDADEEALSMALLYANTPTFAVGHGCAADWSSALGSTSVGEVRAECFPVYEAPSVTPDVDLEDGGRLEVAMGPLAGLAPDDDGLDSLEQLVTEYRTWISRRRSEIPESSRFAEVAARHLDLCAEMADRMSLGLERLRNDAVALRAFRLANQAILDQQLHSVGNERKTTVDKSNRWVIESRPPVPDWRESKRGRWRAFQIGFLLASLCSTIDGDDEDRETVDLIFFPTGGGKTEAYLGLAAISMFHDRLTGVRRGVSVFMRYTLRLLTAQQFVRASALICAMERIRIAEGLDGNRFSIGIWVGNSTTPGTREQAKRDLKKLERDSRDAKNPFLLLKCPWCSAQMGPVETGRSKAPGVAGYRVVDGRVEFRCPDLDCDFSDGLPIYVTDEDVYAERPSIVIGTVDKFARLAWVPQARRLFGIGSDGRQELHPPGLIIQDELHLISGPLGSMVGLYEGIVEELCTDRSGVRPIKPKIVASTATIRKFAEQSKALFGRSETRLFPPHGVDIADSFFAQYAKNEDGTLTHGRRYVGLSAPGLGSMLTAEVRAFSSLLQAAKDLPEDERDPWWTLLSYFNSLRELGIGVSLMQADVPEHLESIRQRRSLEFKDRRSIPHVMELTSRLESDQVPVALKKLEVKTDGDHPVDVCLASNIIEVGIDIGRLSLMTVAGQPKSTSSYIQITGRVGREWKERPGLVVTVYSPTKPRDRSHFERFRSYHQRLYGQVEPVSVTPFAMPVLKRALHAAIVAFVRQSGPSELMPRPTPEDLIDHAVEVLRTRVELVDEESVDSFNEMLAQRLSEWRHWGRSDWNSNREGSSPILRMAGEYVPDELKNVTWPTPSSMRDVDASCLAVVTNLYAIDLAEGSGE